MAAATGWLTAARSPLLAATVVLGTLAGLLALRRHEVVLYGLLAVIALLPFAVVPVRLGAAPTLLDLATMAVFLLWMARAATGRCGADLTPAGVALILFAGTMVAAYVVAAESLRLDETARLFAKLVAAHLLFIPVVNLVHPVGPLRASSLPPAGPGWPAATISPLLPVAPAVDGTAPGRLVTWLMAVAALEATMGIALYAAPRDLAYRLLSSLGAIGYPTGEGVLRYRPDTDILRATGTSVDPNMLGALLMVACALAVAQLLAARPVVPRPVAAGLLAPMAWCLLLTESRGAWLGLAAGVLLLGALKYRRVWAALALAPALALVMPQGERFTGHLLSGLRAQDRAAAMRLGELQNAFQIISRYPWFGVGWGAEGSSIELEYTLGVSNIYLTVAERSGLIALAVYLGALGTLAYVLWPAVRAQRRAPEDDGVLLGLVAALAAALVAGMLDHHFVRFPHLVSLLWITAALAVRTAFSGRE
jgi:O-antigen ligase